MEYLKQINEYFFRQTQNIITIPIKIYAVYLYLYNKLISRFNVRECFYYTNDRFMIVIQKYNV